MAAAPRLELVFGDARRHHLGQLRNAAGEAGPLQSGVRRAIICTRFCVLRLYRRLHHGSSLSFLAELRQAFPFPIKRLQCDHGQEFSLAFVLGVEAAGIRHRYIRPRRPQQNGKVERSHRIDQEEFWRRQRFPDFEVAAAALRDWETRYNYERFSLALQGRTPAEKLAALRPPVEAA
jgi:transposase InsO family protein